MTSSFRRYLLASFFATVTLLPNAGAKPRIVPVRTSAAFSAQSLENRWSVRIKSSDGKTAYVLSLEPDFDIRHHAVTLELVLRHPDDKTDAPNLLDPSGRQHGLQAYDFAADDLAHGAQRSAFGEKRTVYVKSLGLVVQVAISKVTVTPLLRGGHQIDALELQIEVDNGTP